MRDRDHTPTKSPWLFVPSLYFLQGIPYFLVQTASTTFFAALRVPLADIGHAASLLTLPWTIKPLWSPAVDLLSTKRAWTLVMQTLLVAAIAALAFAATRSHVVLWTIVASATLALASATHDIAADGFYLLALDPAQQAGFVGVRNACYRLGRIFVTGAVTYLAGAVEEFAGDKARAWAIAFAAAAAVFAIGLAWCAVSLPRPEHGLSDEVPAPIPDPIGSRRLDGSTSESPWRGSPFLLFDLLDRFGKSPFVAALASYFRQPRIVPVLAFILLYRFGESMLTTMSTPFLLATLDEGGMGFSTLEVGLYSGTIGVLALIVGGIAGGVWIARAGLRRCLWPMALSMHAPNLLYAWAAFTHPGKLGLAGVIAVEQLGYGFGFSAYMVVLMRVSQGRGYSTTHYAVSTGIMGLSAMTASWISGEIAASLGFAGFFVVVCVCALPSIAPLFFVPLGEDAHAAA